MKLKQFIQLLENIAKAVDNPGATEVQMADCVSVSVPILKENIVFITDIPERSQRPV